MIPHKEIKELSNALINTDEFKNMVNQRSAILNNSQLGAKATAFERERKRIFSSNLPPAEISKRLMAQVSNSGQLLQNKQFENMIHSIDEYQKMFMACMDILNKEMDASMKRSNQRDRRY